MADLLALSEAVLDGGKGLAEVGPINRINHRLSVVADGVAVVEAFSHCVLFETDDGLLAFDTSNSLGGARAVAAVRRWRAARFNALVFTHGHLDHVGGSGAFLADAAQRGDPRPRVVGHANVAKRFERYRLTAGYNRVVNERQFGQFRRFGYALFDTDGESTAEGGAFLPEETPEPNVTYRDSHELDVGGLTVQLNHAKGETDDHTWAWIPSRDAVCGGDFFIWNFPNAGNPQKAQRYPLDWARALRAIVGRNPGLFLPAHGLPIAGAERIRRVLIEVAETLEGLVADTLALMNEGARLNDIVHNVRVAPALLAKPYLQPLYDEPEFVVRNIWRLYGGWYDGNPAHLKPPADADLAAEMAHLAGGPLALAKRARTWADRDLRIACQLAEYAAQAAPADAAVHEIRAEVYQRRRDAETSLMGKGIFGDAANASRKRAENASRKRAEEAGASATEPGA